MAGKSDYLENKILRLLCGRVAFTPVATYYVALFTVAPTDAGAGTEVAGNAYARQAYTNAEASFTPNPITGSSCTNALAITFPAATPAGWTTIVAAAVFDAVTAGNLLWWNLLTAQKTIALNDVFILSIGAVTFGED